MRPASATPPPTGSCSVSSGAPASSLSSASSHRPVSPEVDDALPAWVFLHVASVIVWVGAGTTLVLATLYAQRAGDRTLETVTGFAGWLGPRVFAPSSLAALVFGVVAVRSGQWGSPLWVRLGIGAFAVLFCSTLRCPCRCCGGPAEAEPPRRERL